MKRIVIASGKGGTGKTTISTGLFNTSKLFTNKTVTLIDFDVEEPNDHLFFTDSELTNSKSVTVPVPVIDIDKCTFCGKCKDSCAFNAITLIKGAKLAEVSKDLCHSCGACLLACKYDAMYEIQNPIGEVNTFKTNQDTTLIEGRLFVGLPHQTPLIRDLKKNHLPECDIQIFDAPPGTSCPVVTTMDDADYIVVVAEPSPFGLNDLKLLLEVIKDLKIDFGVVINKHQPENTDMIDYLCKKNVEIIDTIPFDREVATAYSNADINKLIKSKDMLSHFETIWNHIKTKIQ